MRLTQRGLALAALSMTALLLTTTFAIFLLVGPHRAAALGAQEVLKNLIVGTGTGSAMVLVMTFLYWRGYRHAAGMAALCLTVLIPLVFIPELFEHTIPQALWIPFILALAISTVWWALATLASSVVLAVATFPAAYAEPYTILVSAIIAVLLIAARLTQDSLLQEAGETRRRAEASAASAREAELRFRMLAAGTFEGIAVTEGDRFIDGNDQLLDMLGYGREELAGLSLRDVLPAEALDRVLPAVAGRRGFHIEQEAVRKDGERILIEARGQPIRAEGQNRHVTAIRDVTRRRQAEAMLLQSRKLEAMGTLAGGIAHDFNNILTAILGFTQLLRGEVADPQAVARYVDQVGAAAGRAKELVRQILAFSRQGPAERSPIDLCRTVEEIRQLVRAAAPATIDVVLDLPPGPAPILATSIELHQVLMNLCINAIDAIGAAPGTIAIAVGPCDGGYRLAVTDSGCGVAPGIRARLFDPYFTTKGPGQGTGLGLSVVHGIVESLGGSVAVESPAEGGARFVVRLPALAAAAAEEPAPAAPPPATRPAAQGRRILVVDDEAGIAEVLQLYLGRRGHDVVATTVSSEALAWIRGGRRFDVVIADHMMPGVTGLELAQAVSACAPGTRMLLCSGRDDMIGDDEMAAAGIRGFLVKPFELEELAELVEG